jgi:hypothetical protein
VTGFVEDTVSYGRTVFTSTDGGENWIMGRDSLMGGEVHVVYANGNLHEVHQYYVDGFSFEIHYMRSSDFGMTWSDPEVLSTLDEYGGMTPRITVDPMGNLYVAWEDSKYGCFNAFGCSELVRMSWDNGANWSEEYVATETPWVSIAQMASSNEHLVIAWGTYANPLRIESRTFATLTLDPCPLENITPLIDPGSQGPIYPNVAIGRKLMAVAWESADTVGATTEFHIWGKVGRVPFSEMEVSYPPGWNLVSLPLASRDVYHLQNMVAYEGGYVHKDTMRLGRGYWAKGDTAIVYGGVYTSAETVDVRERWNIIGSISYPVNTSEVVSIPPGIIQSPFFEFTDLTYAVATTLCPGKAYWVKVNQNGQLVLRSP